MIIDADVVILGALALVCIGVWWLEQRFRR